MGYSIKQGQTAQSLVFLMIDSTDHIAPKTGLSPTVTISKNGAAFGSPVGAVSEIGSGWYKVAGNATDAGTLGPLALHATATGADPVDELFHVVAFDPLSATNLGLANLDAQVSTRSTFAGGAVSSVTGDVGGDLLGSVGSVAASVTATLAATQPNYAPAKSGDAMALTTGERTAIADAVLTRDWTAVTGEASRSALNALRWLRNKWSVAAGTLTVTKEDDAATAWTAALTTDSAAEPVTASDPS